MIPAWVAKYVGLPFSHHGRGPAYDCWGLVKLALKDQFDIEAPDFGELYINDSDRAGIPAAFELGKITWHRVESPQEGDVAILLIAGKPMHCGLVVAPPCMLHARTAAGSCVERYDGPVWNRRIEGFYRHSSFCNQLQRLGAVAR